MTAKGPSEGQLQITTVFRSRCLPISPSAAISPPKFSRMPISQSGRAELADNLERPHHLLRTSVNDSDGHQDPRSAAERAHHVGRDTEQAQDGPAKRRGSGNDALQFLVHASLAVTGNDHALVLQLLGDLSRTRAGDLDPRFGKDGTGGDDEGNVDDGMERVHQRRCDGARGRDVVCQP